jgi:hypothetical protein
MATATTDGNTLRVTADIEHEDPDDITVQDDQNVVVPPTAAGAAAQTTLAFKVEQSKIPEYYGQKGKDNITAIVFIRKIEDLARTNRWTDATTYANVANNLKGFAREWLFATTEMLDWTPDQLTWTNLKPRFQRQFATQTDEKMIMEGLSNLAMKPGESTGELLARITNTMVIIKESYANYENKPPAPANFDVNNGFTMPVCRQWRDDVLNNTQQFLKMQLFRAALTPELRKVVAQRNPNNMTLDDMYQIAMDTQCEAGPKIKQAVAAVQPETEEEEIAAFQKRKNKNFNQKKGSSYTSSNSTNKGGYKSYSDNKGYASNFKGNSGPGNNTNRNGKYCFYCKLQNHTQEDCFKRIREKKPCRDRQGRAYWPRVYLTENSDSQNQGQQQQGFH